MESVQLSAWERELLEAREKESEALRARGPILTLGCGCQVIHGEAYMYCIDHGFPDPDLEVVTDH
jgi:hypothetical protein